MRNSRIYLTGFRLVFLFTAGCSGVHGPIPSLGDNGRGRLTTTYTIKLTDEDASIVSTEARTTLCVLPGNASEAVHGEYEACIAEAECGDWEKYQDDGNGNTAMICLDQDRLANACILGENESVAEQIEFADCLRIIKCVNRRRHRDVDSGTTIMLCQDG